MTRAFNLVLFNNLALLYVCIEVRSYLEPLVTEAIETTTMLYFFSHV